MKLKRKPAPRKKAFTVGTDPQKGVVFLDFGATPVNTLGLPPETARALGEALILRADELEDITPRPPSKNPTQAVH